MWGGAVTQGLKVRGNDGGNVKKKAEQKMNMIIAREGENEDNRVTKHLKPRQQGKKTSREDVGRTEQRHAQTARRLSKNTKLRV